MIQHFSVKYHLSMAILLLPAPISETAATAQVATNVIALTGDAAPDGNGSFSYFINPALNDAGQVAFVARLADTRGSRSDDLGIFRGNGSSTHVQIARKGQAVPDGSGTFSPSFFFGPPALALNEAGHVAFVGHFTDTFAGSNDSIGLFRGNGPSSLIQIARSGDVAPDSNGAFSRLGISHNPTLNDTGQAAFRSFLTSTSGGNIDSSGIFRGDGTSSPVQIAREGDATTDGNGRFSSFDIPALNNIGQVAFHSFLTGTIGGSSDNSSIFRGDGTSSPVQIAREGQTAPDGNGSFSSFLSFPVLNDSGQVAFLSSLTGTNGGNSDDVGIFRGNGTSSPVQIARAGNVAPDGNGNFSDFIDSTINDSGQVAFLGLLTGTRSGFRDDRGIFRGDGMSRPVQLAREGQTAPDGKGIFSEFRNPALNDAGQAAFLAYFTSNSSGSRDHGLYLYDDLLGLMQVARVGDTLLDSTITRLSFVDSSAFIGDEQSGLNEHGQIAFQFALADGREGIAVASVVPEPSTLLLGMIASTTLILRIRL